MDRLWTQLKNLKCARAATGDDLTAQLRRAEQQVRAACVVAHSEGAESADVWRFKDIKPLILEAGKLVPIEYAERRVLQLINPGLKRSGFTTVRLADGPHPDATQDSLYAGIQSVLPGEVAPAHRHVAHAQRFIIQVRHGRCGACALFPPDARSRLCEHD